MVPSQKDLYFYVSIHSQVKYVRYNGLTIMTTKTKSTCSVNLTKGYWQIVGGMVPCFHPML